ncbi:MAG: filamentous hemagglutinin N-terminal domain-containing protein, partial [Methylococcaceae bacterium]
ESATFSGSAGIKNVISRVTGGQASTIDGVFRSTIPNANVYFLNPSGIIFGENSSLDVQGSFHASTANYLKFKDGVKFETGLATENPILTTANPEAFGFLDDAPASISISGGHNKVLEVPENETLFLVGGDITIDNRSLYAPSGQVVLASAGSAGELVFNNSGIDTSSFTKGGDIHLSRAANTPIVIINETMQIADIDVSADAAGKVVIRGGQMVMDNAYIWADTTNKDGGDIDIDLAGDLTINGVAEIAGVEKTPQSGITANTQGKGNAGNIVLNVDDLKLTHDTRIDSTTTSKSSGDGGDLNITANSILLEGNDSKAVPRLITTTSGSGDGGNIITAIADSLEINEGASIWSFASASGRGGNLFVETNSLKINNADITSLITDSGNGGDLNITANNVTALNSARISSMVGKTGTGISGDINLVANDTISLSGKQTFISSDTHGKGNSGNISVKSNSLDIQNEASIFSTTTNAGHSGNLLIDSKNISLTNDSAAMLDGSKSTSATGINTNIVDFDRNGTATGHSGNLTVLSQQLTLNNGANISAKNFGQGNSGNLSVKSDNITLTTDIDVGIHTSHISNSGKGSGRAGNLTITSHNNLILENATRIEIGNNGAGSSGNLLVNAKNIFLTGDGSEQKTGILNNAYPDGTGSVGDLTVNSEYLSIRNGSQISSIAFGSVDAGNIAINSQYIEVISNGKMTGLNTQTQNTGNAGDILIKTDKITLSGESAVILSDSISTDNVNSGNAGNITIEGITRYNALGEIIPTKAELITVKDGAGISTGTLGKGNSGKITIKANKFNANNNASITALTNANGQGGDIEIISNTFEMHDNSEIQTTTSGSGSGGNLTIITEDFLLNDSNLLAGSTFEDFDSSLNATIAKSGNISITTTGTSLLENNSLIVALTKKANAGDISINGNNILKLSDDSRILTSVADGAGNGGNISISTPIVAVDDSFISSRAVDGNGGNITIPGYLFLSPLSAIDASSEKNTPGELNLNPVTNISGSIAVLPDSALNASEHLSDRCGSRSGNNTNSFMIKSRGGVPLSPENPIPSTFIDIKRPSAPSVNTINNTLRLIRVCSVNQHEFFTKLAKKLKNSLHLTT